MRIWMSISCVALSFLAACAGTKAGRELVPLQTRDGTVYVSRPADEVLETAMTVGLDRITKDAVTNSASLGWRQEVQRVIDQNPELHVYEVMRYLVALDLASMAITKEEYLQRTREIDDLLIEVTKKK